MGGSVLTSCCPLRHWILGLSICLAVLLSANVSVFNFTLLCLREWPLDEATNSSLSADELPDITLPPFTTAHPTTTATTPVPTTTRRPSLRLRDPGPTSSNRTKDLLTLAVEEPKIARNASLEAAAEMEDAELLELLALIDRLEMEQEIEERPSSQVDLDELKRRLNLDGDYEIIPDAAPLLANHHSFHGRDTFALPDHLVSGIYAIYATGALLALVPVCYAVQKMGLRLPVAIAALISILASVAFFGALSGSPFILLGVRAVQGLGVAAILPLGLVATTSWGGLREYPGLLGVFASVEDLGVVISVPVAAAFAHSGLGWPWVKYALACLALLFLVAWAALYRNQPRRHAWLSGLELDAIIERKVLRPSKRKAAPQPWGRVVSSPGTWLILSSATAHFLCQHLLLLGTPLFLHRRLHLSLLETGLFSALPPLLACATRLLTTPAFELGPLSPTSKLRVFGGIGHFGAGLALGGLAFLPPGHTAAALSLLSLAHLSLGFHLGGWQRAIVLGLREAAPLGFFLSTVASLVLATLLPFFLLEAVGTGAWRILLLFPGGLSLVAGIAWGLFASGRPLAWTRGFERHFKGSPKLVEPVGEEDDDAVSIDQGILELRTIAPAPMPHRDEERQPLRA